MPGDKNSLVSPLFRELVQPNLYKRSQGRIARQVTFGALALGTALGAWRMSVYATGEGPIAQYAAPGLLFLVGLWVCYRIVNYPRFADFLIAVEAEMNKVSWPTRIELFRASAVVIFSIFSLAIILFAYDLFWRTLLTLLGVLGGGTGSQP